MTDHNPFEHINGSELFLATRAYLVYIVVYTCQFRRPPTSFRWLLILATSCNRKAKSSAPLPGRPCPLHATIFHVANKHKRMRNGQDWSCFESLRYPDRFRRTLGRLGTAHQACVLTSLWLFIINRWKAPESACLEFHSFTKNWISTVTLSAANGIRKWHSLAKGIWTFVQKKHEMCSKACNVILRRG